MIEDILIFASTSVFIIFMVIISRYMLKYLKEDRITFINSKGEVFYTTRNLLYLTGKNGDEYCVLIEKITEDAILVPIEHFYKYIELNK